MLFGTILFNVQGLYVVISMTVLVRLNETNPNQMSFIVGYTNTTCLVLPTESVTLQVSICNNQKKFFQSQGN